MIIKVNVILMEEVEFDKDSHLKEELDNSWVEEFEEQDNMYKDFYKEQVQTVKIILFYIDKNNSITSGKKISMPLDNGILKKHILIKMLNENMTHNSIKYRPISLIKWNIDLEPEYLINFLKDKEDSNKDKFINIETEIKDIEFRDTINILQDINTFYVLFHESWKSYHNRSKKIYIKKNKLKRNNLTKRFKGS